MSTTEIKGKTFVKYTGQEETVVVPEGIEKICARAFYDNKHVKKVILPSTLKFIMMSAFSGCTNLREIVLPNNLQKLGLYAFKDCDNIKEFYIPKSVKDLYGTSFPLHAQITVEPGSAYTIQDDCLLKGNTLIKYIGHKATAFTVPSYITEIAENAFYCNDTLTSVVIPSTVQALDKNTFFQCEALERCEFQCELEKVPNGCFEMCANLKTVVFPVGVTSIGEWAFSFCEKLQIEQLPESVRYIEKGAFALYKGTPFFEENSNVWKAINLGLATVDILKYEEEIKRLENLKEKHQLNFGSIDDLDKWHNIILVEKRNFKLLNNEFYDLIKDRYISGKDATKLFYPSAVKKLGSYCKLIHYHCGEFTIYTEIPQSEWLNLDAKSENRNGNFLKTDLLEIEFDENAYGSIYLPTEFPDEGIVWAPFRFRMLEGDIPTEKNIGGGFENTPFANYCHESYKLSEHRILFNVGMTYYSLYIKGCESVAGNSQIIDYKIGQDKKGHYIDVLLCMEVHPSDKYNLW